MSAPVERGLQDYLNELVGKRCEGADIPVGSVLRIDIGPLGLGPHDEPDSQPHGWRHLTVKCPWRLEAANEVLCDWNTPESVLNYLDRIVGQEVKRISASLPGLDLRLTLSNGVALTVFADSTVDRDDAWFVLGTDGFELTAGPVRSDYQGWRVQWAHKTEG